MDRQLDGSSSTLIKCWLCVRVAPGLLTASWLSLVESGRLQSDFHRRFKSVRRLSQRRVAMRVEMDGDRAETGSPRIGNTR